MLHASLVEWSKVYISGYILYLSFLLAIVLFFVLFLVVVAFVACRLLIVFFHIVVR